MNYHLDINERKLIISHEGLEDIVVNLADAAMTVWQGTSKYLEVKAGGGHWETSAVSGVSDQAGGFETSGGFILVHQIPT